MASPSDLLVTGVGLFTSLGTMRAAAAAHRAGIVRASALSHCRVGSADLEEVPAIGRPVRGRTEGFIQAGLWCRLALGAFEDLSADAAPTPADIWQRTALIACLPHLDPGRFAVPVPDPQAPRVADALVDATFFQPLVAIAGIAAPPELRESVFGHCGLALALTRATERLRADGRIQRVLVLAADSYTDAQSLGWLLQDGRLRTDANAEGVIPGEAGAAILLERPASAATRKATVLARISPGTVHCEPGADDDAPAASGVRIAATLERALQGIEPAAARDAYVDLNGEAWRASAWGHAQVTLQAAGVREGLRPNYPATGFGELGAAAAPVALGLAVRSFARGYGTAAGAVICSLDERRAASALALLRP